MDSLEFFGNINLRSSRRFWWLACWPESSSGNQTMWASNSKDFAATAHSRASERCDTRNDWDGQWYQSWELLSSVKSRRRIIKYGQTQPLKMSTKFPAICQNYDAINIFDLSGRNTNLCEVFGKSYPSLISCLSNSSTGFIVAPELPFLGNRGRPSCRLIRALAKLPSKLEPGFTDAGEFPHVFWLPQCHAMSVAGDANPSICRGGGRGGGGPASRELGMDTAMVRDLGWLYALEWFVRGLSEEFSKTISGRAILDLCEEDPRAGISIFYLYNLLQTWSIWRMALQWRSPQRRRDFSVKWRFEFSGSKVAAGFNHGRSRS